MTLSGNFEKIIDNRIRNILEDTYALAECQFGFRKKRSTVDALDHLLRIRDDSGKRRRNGILTLDIKNAFNSAPWPDILNALRGKGIPLYLCRIVDSYLRDRSLTFEAHGCKTEMVLSCGVPQGSVLGPTLWNVLYDDLLSMPLPRGVEYLAFADDVALVATVEETYTLEKMLSTAAKQVVTKLADIGLELAAQKSEAIVITGKRQHNEMTIDVNGTRILAGNNIKYLGIQIDKK